MIVADRGEGSRRSGATAVRQQAEVVVRIPPATFPREPEEGHPCTGLRWLRQRGGPEREWPGWWGWEGRRYPVRLVAAPRTPAAAQQARRRQRRQAPKAGRLRTMPTRAVAGWLLVITTRDVGTWAAAAGLSGYRARWQGERVCKKMQQRLRRNQMRRKHRTSVEATVRARLVAWALHAGTTSLLRTLLSAPATTETVVSRWLVSGVGLDTVRQQGQGRWSEARLQVCLPRLRRFLWSRPRRRGHQEGAVRAGLAQRASPCFGSQQQVA